MNLDGVFLKYTPNENALLKFGFEKKKDCFELKKNLSDGSLYALFLLSAKKFEVGVFEIDGGEEYLPFNIHSAEGAFVSEIRAEVKSFTDEILKKCFDKNSLKDDICIYVREKYGTCPEYPWEEDDAFVFRAGRKNRWYGLVMNIPYRRLGINTDGFADVMNLKNLPEKIAQIIDGKRFFPAYHMNKTHWFTVLLDKNADMEEIKILIDESYDIIEK